MGWAADHRHLPAGAAPGSQSRRRVRSRQFAFWILALIGLGFLVGGIATLPGDGIGEESLFILAVALLLIGGAFAVRRSSWKKAARHLQVSVSPGQVGRGQPVSVRLDVVVALPAEATVEVGLVCSEIYDYIEVIRTQQGRSRSRSTKVVDAYAEWMPAQPTGGSQQFGFTVPYDAPYSYEGDCVSYAWRVTARERKEIGRDPVRDVPIWVRP